MPRSDQIITLILSLFMSLDMFQLAKAFLLKNTLHLYEVIGNKWLLLKVCNFLACLIFKVVVQRPIAHFPIWDKLILAKKIQLCRGSKTGKSCNILCRPVSVLASYFLYWYPIGLGPLRVTHFLGYSDVFARERTCCFRS